VSVRGYLVNATARLKQRLGITWNSGIHRRVGNWPERLVVVKTPKGWERCDLCDQEHRIWIVEDGAWDKLPPRLRTKRLCVKCYRREATR
jgi:hypothetical protein